MRQQHDAGQMQVITVSREYGSGGGEIAARLSRRLGWKLIDHEVVAMVAERLGVTPEEVEPRDERVEGLVSRILSNAAEMDSSWLVAPPATHMITDDMYYQALREIVEASAQVGHVVIVGRGAQVILTDRRDALHLRVIAPEEARVRYVSHREGLDEAAAKARIRAKDRSRHQFVQSRYHRDPADAHLYDLVLNTGSMSLDSAVDVTLLALEGKGRQLGLPEQELGPAAGIGPYPGRPRDLAG